MKDRRRNTHLGMERRDFLAMGFGLAAAAAVTRSAAGAQTGAASALAGRASSPIGQRRLGALEGTRESALKDQ
ncbi:MAG: hypothetical protein EHM24_33925 [Acidobacteria bacterium]|nr:MAG: hypothetical protein EHM24_33925 [Acidobacteriota bacterium]RPJ77713.1 MAG: hypothetical protein EHM13_15625 [Acidobacteriota bacterium]